MKVHRNIQFLKLSKKLDNISGIKYELFEWNPVKEEFNKYSNFPLTPWQAKQECQLIMVTK